MAFEVGGAFWLSFADRRAVALLTGFAYAELITKYPQAAGASLYVHKAFGKRPITFMVTFSLLAATVSAAGALPLTFGGEYFKAFIEDVAADPRRGRLHRAAVAAQLPRHLRVRLGQPRHDADRVGRAADHPGHRRRGARQGRRRPVAAVRAQRRQPRARHPGRGRRRVLRHDRLRERCQRRRGDAATRAEVFPKALLGGMALAGVALPPHRVHRVDGHAAEGAHRRTRAPAAPCSPWSRPGPSRSRRSSSPPSRSSRSPTRPWCRSSPSRASCTAWRGRASCRASSPAPTRSAHAVGGDHVHRPLLVIILLITTDVGTLAEVTVLFLITVYGMVCLSALVLRRSPVDHDHYTAPTALLVLGVASNIALLVYTGVDHPESLIYCGGMLGGRRGPLLRQQPASPRTTRHPSTNRRGLTRDQEVHMHVLIATDGSQQSLEAARYLRQFADAVDDRPRSRCSRSSARWPPCRSPRTATGPRASTTCRSAARPNGPPSRSPTRSAATGGPRRTPT